MSASCENPTKIKKLGGVPVIAQLKDWLAGKRQRSQGASVKSRMIASVSERMDRYAEAVTFAEAGEADIAREVVRQVVEERPKILVLGPEGQFSRPVIDYAVGFAKRTGYEIVALSCSAGGTVSDGAEALMHRAAEEDVPCHHVVKYGTSDGCVREIHDEIRRVEFVITEPEASFENGMEPIIPVFCLSA